MNLHPHASAPLTAGRGRFLPFLAGMAFALPLLFAVPAAGHDYRFGDLAVVHAWTHATPAGATTGAGYVTIHNRGSSADRLVSVASPAAQRAEIHEMAVDAAGVMTMRPVAGGLEIPAGGRAVLKPGSYHIMFLELRQPAEKGKRLPATLTFERAGPVEVEFMVQEMAGQDRHETGGHGG